MLNELMGPLLLEPYKLQTGGHGALQVLWWNQTVSQTIVHLVHHSAGPHEINSPFSPSLRGSS